MKEKKIISIAPDGSMNMLVTNDQFMLSTLQTICGGYVQAVNMTGTMDMWCNEEGKMNGSEWNEIATAIWHAVYGATDTIFGTVAFTGVPDMNGNTRGISEDDIARLGIVRSAFHEARHADTPAEV